MKKISLKTLLIGLLLLLLLLLAFFFRKTEEPPVEKTPTESQIDNAISEERENVAEAETSEVSEEVYESPVDFDALQAANPDICAWLDIPGTEISYPVLLREGDNTFYLNHAENGSESRSGSLFMEDYNHADCSDAALAVYGHHMKSGAYFGNLQDSYETEAAFKEHQDIILYLPDRQINYRVFAAVPYSDTHLLYTFHFENTFDFNDFIERVTTIRSFSAQFDSQETPDFGQQLLILSTCLKGDNTQRYLVIGAEKEVLQP